MPSPWPPRSPCLPLACLLACLLFVLQTANVGAAPPVRGRVLGSKPVSRAKPAGKEHPRQRLPRGTRRLSSRAAAKSLQQIRKAQPTRSLAELRPGLTRYRSIAARIDQLASVHSSAVKTSQLGDAFGLRIAKVELVGSKPVPGKRLRVLIIGGVHAGTEVVGTEAATRFVEMAAKNPSLRNQFDITVIPMLNPSGMVLGTRKNAGGEDINRSFQAGAWTHESRLLRDFAQRETFDLVIDMHGAGNERTNGFFILRGGNDGGMSNRVLSSMKTSSLNDVAGAGGKPAQAGPYRFDRLGSATSETAGTLKAFFASRGARYSYTFEAPTRMNGEAQVRGMVKLLRSTLHNVRKHGDW